MSLLYLAGESDADEDFFADCAEKVIGNRFQRVRLRNRRGDGVDAVRRQAKNALLIAVAAAEGPEPVAFITGMDNDRAPHPENSKSSPVSTGLDRERLPDEDKRKDNRYDWLESLVKTARRQHKGEWRLSVAIAVPVEMIESWIVRALSEHPPQPTPHFSTKGSSGVWEYYEQTVGDTPQQWKDLADAEIKRLRLADHRALRAHFVANLDAEALARRSLSFRMFKEWLDAWPKSAPNANE